MAENNVNNTEVERMFAPLRDLPERETGRAANGRAVFLAQAQQMADLLPARVSPNGKARHNHWKQQLGYLFTWNRKEHTPMVSLLSTILIIFSLVVGSGGVTVAAAQQSMPGDDLYPVKTWSEQLRVQLTENDRTRVQLALELADRRAVEMQNMLRSGTVPPQTVQHRLQVEIDRALDAAARQVETERVQSLAQIRTRLQEQEQEFSQLQSQAGPQGETVLAWTRTMIQDRLRICDDAIKEPDVSLDRIRQRNGLQRNSEDNPHGKTWQFQQTAEPSMEPSHEPEGGYGPGPGDGAGSSDGEDHSGENNPWTEDLPTPQSGYGPGPGDGDGECEGCQDGANNPWTDSTPTPGSGYGPGPQPEEPPHTGAGDGESHGPGPGSGTSTEASGQVGEHSGEGAGGSGYGGKN